MLFVFLIYFTGVRVNKGNEQYDLRAPCVISAAGAINTFKKLLPKDIAEKSSTLFAIDETLTSESNIKNAT